VEHRSCSKPAIDEYQRSACRNLCSARRSAILKRASDNVALVARRSNGRPLSPVQAVNRRSTRSLVTSLPKANAAGFRLSTVVRYGKIVSARSSTVSPCRIANVAVWMLSAPSGARIGRRAGGRYLRRRQGVVCGRGRNPTLSGPAILAARVMCSQPSGEREGLATAPHRR
jgi:hypothetical protein